MKKRVFVRNEKHQAVVTLEGNVAQTFMDEVLLVTKSFDIIPKSSPITLLFHTDTTFALSGDIIRIRVLKDWEVVYEITK